MGQLTFQATLGGAVNLIGPNTAATTNLTLPAADGTSGQALTTNGSGTLAFANIPLASAVSGTLPIANGGTGTTSTTFANLTTTVTGTLPIANGGTNSTATATAGGIGYGTGTAHAYTSAGTSGQVLTSAGASAPTWTNPAGGSLIFLSSVTASSSATVDVETTFDSTYDQYLITVSGLLPAQNNLEFGVQFKQGGSYRTTGYRYHTSLLRTNTSSYAASTSSDYSYMLLAQNLSNSFVANYHLIISTPTVTDMPRIFGHGTFFYANLGVMAQAIPMGYQANTSGAIQGVRFLSESGNITSGTFRLYGIKNS